MNHTPASIPERVILFGNENSYSRPVLRRLLACRVNIVAIVMPGVMPPASGIGDIPVRQANKHDQSSLAGLAKARGIHVLRTQYMQAPHFASELKQLACDIVLIACFPMKLPTNIWQLPALACWNLHPSLLPRYRGPAPLYWQRRQAETHTGITLHEVRDRLDAGDIVAQEARPFPGMTDTSTVNEWIADIGVRLFLESLHQARRGRLVTTPQDETLASYFPHADHSGHG